MESANTVSGHDAISRLSTPPPPPEIRHIFLCYQSCDVWASKFEDFELPKILASAIKSRQEDMKFKTYLTTYGACDGITCADGDVLAFPDMVKYRGLKESDVEGFVDDVLVNGKAWEHGVQESMSGSYIFVCAHAKRNWVCGESGPVLIKKFMEEITARDLTDLVSVYACSHFQYTKEVITFRPNSDGKVTGHWFFYVSLKDVPDFIDHHIGRGKITENLQGCYRGVYKQGYDYEDEDEDHGGYGSPSHCPVQ